MVEKTHLLNDPWTYIVWCPEKAAEPDSSIRDWSDPSTTIQLSLVAIICLVNFFSIVCSKNRVRLYSARTLQGPTHNVNVALLNQNNNDKADRTARQTVNNTLWALFFLFAFIRFGSAAASVGARQKFLKTEGPEGIDKVVQFVRYIGLVSKISGTAATMFLTHALAHHYRLKLNDSYGDAPSPFQRGVSYFFHVLATVVTLGGVAGYVLLDSRLKLDKYTTTAEYWGSVAAEIAPIIVTFVKVFILMCSGYNNRPTTGAKVFLLIGVMLYLIAMFPPSVLNIQIALDYVRDHNCPANSLSLYDLVQGIGAVFAMFFIFAFVNKEFKRCEEIEIYEHFRTDIDLELLPQ